MAFNTTAYVFPTRAKAAFLGALGGRGFGDYIEFEVGGSSVLHFQDAPELDEMIFKLVERIESIQIHPNFEAALTEVLFRGRTWDKTESLTFTRRT